MLGMPNLSVATSYGLGVRPAEISSDHPRRLLLGVGWLTIYDGRSTVEGSSLRLWVPETRQRLRDLRRFVDQASESIASDHRDGWVRRHRRKRSKRRSLSQGPVRAVGVEMGLVLTQHQSGVCGVDDQDPVQHLTDTAHEPFADRVRHRL
jgi:hypothetical protein